MTTGPLLRARNTDVSSRIPRHGITIAILVSLGRWEELEMHVRAALEQDLSRDQTAEVLLPTASYGGVPAAKPAFGYADRVLRPKDTRA
jgi:alkylhydroperoxidase/carboxymuconolactone decarboxylase family protein YurZ